MARRLTLGHSGVRLLFLHSYANRKDAAIRPADNLARAPMAEAPDVHDDVSLCFGLFLPLAQGSSLDEKEHWCRVDIRLTK